MQIRCIWKPIADIYAEKWIKHLQLIIFSLKSFFAIIFWMSSLFEKFSFVSKAWLTRKFILDGSTDIQVKHRRTWGCLSRRNNSKETCQTRIITTVFVTHWFIQNIPKTRVFARVQVRFWAAFPATFWFCTLHDHDVKCPWTI